MAPAVGEAGNSVRSSVVLHGRTRVLVRLRALVLPEQGDSFSPCSSGMAFLREPHPPVLPSEISPPVDVRHASPPGKTSWAWEGGVQ
ncbi:Hypothetical protein NTJ_02733 [Nesidiocoris tenuis]|uniref:Uncharacterized protein n=1 Tax=Nesidiocoris tenuis TaxID=355587 RepID=A0ABN7AGD6_9HEMI|nr:Hypothetical protein NTJ_02733 [Nesidiocoris tenuis]